MQVVVETHDGIIHGMSPWHHLYFLAFFPTFTSGPIDRSRRFEEDVDDVPTREEYADLLGRAILLIMLGMVYSMVVAAVVRTWWNPVAWSAGGTDLASRLWYQVRTCYAYGLYHGLLLAAEQGWEKTGFYKSHRHQSWYRVASWFVTMQLVFLGFALFSGQISLLVKGP